MEEVPEIPEDENLEIVKGVVESHPRVRFVGDHSSGGIEYKVSEESQEWLIELVKENKVKFDNPNRIDSGHSFGLILPDE